MEHGHEHSLGRQLSTVAILDKIALISAPVMGGLIITFFGFETLFVAVLALVIASTFPIFFTPHHAKRAAPPLKELAQNFRAKDFRNDLVAYMGAGAENSIGEIIWPIFLFGLVGSFATLGIVSSGIILLSSAAAWLAGQLLDKKDKAKILKAGAYSRSAFWILLSFAGTIPEAFLLQSASRIAAEFMWLPFDAFTYIKAGNGDSLKYILLREWAINLGGLLTLLLMALFLFLQFGFLAAFSLAALGAFLTVRISRATLPLAQKPIKKGKEKSHVPENGEFGGGARSFGRAQKRPRGAVVKPD